MWKLKHDDDNDKTLDYYISTTSQSATEDKTSPLKLNDVVFSIAATEKGEKTINIYCGLITTQETITYYGTYSDTLKFTVSIDSDPSSN